MEDKFHKEKSVRKLNQGVRKFNLRIKITSSVLTLDFPDHAVHYPFAYLNF